MKYSFRGRCSGFTLVELLVVIAIIGVLVALLLPAIQAAREAARRNTCKNHLKQQGLALQNYHAVEEKFPIGLAGGDGGHNFFGPKDDGYGWAVALLPHLEQQPLYDLIDPDWLPAAFSRGLLNPGRMIPGGDTQLEFYRCPSSGLPDFAESNNPNAIVVGYATSDYKACAGVSDMGIFFNRTDGWEAGKREGSGIYARGYSQVRIRDVTDGLSNTIAIGESAYYGFAKRAWPIWMGAPGGSSDECTLFKTDDRAPINAQTTKNLAAFEAGQPFDDDCAFSWHQGGAYFAFADGSVHWLDENIAVDVYGNLGTRNDGNIVPSSEF